MDYEKRYNDALEKAIEWEKKYILTNIISPDGTMAKEFKEIFPQLADSEEERIRKWLIKEMRRFHDCAVHEMCREDIDKTETALAWLEKQKEQKPISQEDFDIAKHEALWEEQKPAGWSEELAILEGYIISGDWSDAHKERALDILKSLRPQPHWKPSEELMGCLERVIAFKNPEPEDIKGCEELLDQLKKL